MTELVETNLNREWQDKVVIVTGAASGIGLATTRLLHARGATVIAVSLGDDVHELEGARIVPLQLDVSEEQSAVAAVELAIDRFGRLDLLVNNAGRIINKLAVDMTLDDWNSVFAVNATAPFLFSREAIRAMSKKGGGAIVNVGSYACFQAFPTIAAYASSKGALAQLTRALSLEAIEHGIRVNAVGSGDTITNFLNHLHADGQTFLAEHGSKAPIGRAAQPEEIAEVIAFVGSPRASYMVGAVVMTDGGMSVTTP